MHIEYSIGAVRGSGAFEEAFCLRFKELEPSTESVFVSVGFLDDESFEGDDWHFVGNGVDSAGSIHITGAEPRDIARIKASAVRAHFYAIQVLPQTIARREHAERMAALR